MKNNKGITLIALVITIIILLILVSITTYSGLGIIKSSKFESFKTELKVMQAEVNRLYEKYKKGETITTSLEEMEISDIGDNQLSGDDEELLMNLGLNSEGYRIWNSNFIKNELKIEIVDQDFLVNIEKRSVVSRNGFNYEGTIYYTLDQLPDGLYNVEYEPLNANKPTFDVNCENKGNEIYNIKISNIQYDGYINKWEVWYKKENEENWIISDKLDFFVEESGTYKIKLHKNILETGEIVESDEEVVNAN